MPTISKREAVLRCETKEWQPSQRSETRRQLKRLTDKVRRQDGKKAIREQTTP